MLDNCGFIRATAEPDIGFLLFVKIIQKNIQYHDEEDDEHTIQ
jgi:hypothetical protein